MEHTNPAQDPAFKATGSRILSSMEGSATEQPSDARELDTYYFAYGRNMRSSIIADRLKHAPNVLGPATLNDYRISFNQVNKNGERRATLRHSPGVCTDGVLYRVSQSDLDLLDRAEGVFADPPKYQRACVAVLHKGTERMATAYIGASASSDDTEKLPPSEYLNDLAAGAAEHGLHRSYQSFLRRLIAKSSTLCDGHLSLVIPTADRSHVRTSLPVVEAPVDLLPDVAHGGTVCVTWQKRRCLASLYRDRALSAQVCRLDQEARHALGFVGRRCHGERVSIEAASVRASLAGSRYRTLTLPLLRTASRDSEKRICVLHPARIRMLGLDEGAWILLLAVSDIAGERQVRVIRRRVLSGTPSNDGTWLLSDGATSQGDEYPRPDYVYLDLEARIALFGTGGNEIHQPVTIVPDIRSMFANRIVLYGAATFATMLALMSVTQPIAAEHGWSQTCTSLLTVAVAIALSIIMIITDIRHRTRY